LGRTGKETPVKLLKKHAAWFWDRIGQDRLDSTAAHGAFFLLISFLPFVAFLLTLMQRIHFSDGVTLIEAALQIFPESVAVYLEALLPDPIHSSGVLPVAVIAAVWSSSMGMLAIIKGLDQIFQVEEQRGFIRLRITAVIYVFIFAAVLILAAALLVFGSSVYQFLMNHVSSSLAWLLIKFKSLAGFVLLFLFFILLYTGVPRRRTRFPHILAGAAFSAGGWVVFSTFFSIFVENFSDFSIYGSLATLVILMFWLFSCMYIMFLGAEVTMWLETSSIANDCKNLRKKWKKHRTRRKLRRSQSRCQRPPQKKE
jgi:membrane protein